MHAGVLQQLKESSYNCDAVVAVEEKNQVLFNKYAHLNIPHPKDHFEIYEVAFGKFPAGDGALDIGTGGAGTLQAFKLREMFTGLCMQIDPFECRECFGWDRQIMKGEDILKVFGRRSFDIVQCTETLEHVGEVLAEDIAAQMIEVCRKYALITCCGLSHHLGPENMAKVSENKFLEYKGQPDIEMLMRLGYTVKLAGGYQIIASFTRKD